MSAATIIGQSGTTGATPTDASLYRFALSVPRFVEHTGDWRRNAPQGKGAIVVGELPPATDGGPTLLFIERGPVPVETGKGKTRDGGALPCVSDPATGSAEHCTPDALKTPTGGARIIIDPQAVTTPAQLRALMVALLTGAGLGVTTPEAAAQDKARALKADQRKLRKLHEPGILDAAGALTDGRRTIAGVGLFALPAGGGPSLVGLMAQAAQADGLIPSDALCGALRKAHAGATTDATRAGVAGVLGILGVSLTPDAPAVSPTPPTTGEPGAGVTQGAGDTQAGAQAGEPDPQGTDGGKVDPVTPTGAGEPGAGPGAQDGKGDAPQGGRRGRNR